MQTDDGSSSRFLLYTVGLDGDCNPIPSIAWKRESNNRPVGFPLHETRILMKMMQDESFYWFHPISPVLVASEEKVMELLDEADGRAWMEIEIEGQEGERFSVALSALRGGQLFRALEGLHDMYDGDFYVDCGANIRILDTAATSL
jgi:hypothetical protein